MMINKNTQSPIASRFRMLKQLIQSKAERKVIAVWSASFENFLKLCTVEEVSVDRDENEVIVILRDASTGISTHRDSFTLFLNEIGQVNMFINSMR